MKRKSKRRGNEPLNYWQSTADMMSALLLILLLVIMLLLLYIIQIPEEEYVDMYPGSYSSSVASSDSDGGWGGGSSEGGYWPDDWDDWDGGGGGGDGDEEYEYPSGGGAGIGIGFGKTAVYVMVIDAETEATIKESGVQFELYTYDGGIQFLNTYYPRRIEYRKYETTNEGVFYLPEKIFQGHYYFHELTEPDGYDSAGNVEFYANEDRDWDEPLIVTVPLYPSKNIIRIQMTDADTGEPVTGGVYDVVAAEDIITKDGTLRYSAGQTVDQIICDENGYGESMELYLGNYTLEQSTVPPYYAADEGEPLEVTVEKKHNDVLPAIHTIPCEKTTVTIQVADELYETGIGGASFRLTRSGESPSTVTADDNGLLVLTNLDKGVTYRLRQLSSGENYRFDTAEFVFSVSLDGRVEEEAQKEYTISNRLIRVRMSVVDRVLRANMSDYNIALYDSQNQLVGVWDSSGLAHSLDGLEPGTYYAVLDGKTDIRHTAEIQDTAEVQEIRIPVWTLPGVAILAAVIAAAAGLIALLVHWRRTHPRRRMPSRALLAAVFRAKQSKQNSASAASSETPAPQLAAVPAPASGESAEESGQGYDSSASEASASESDQPAETTETASSETPAPEAAAEPGKLEGQTASAGQKSGRGGRHAPSHHKKGSTPFWKRKKPGGPAKH